MDTLSIKSGSISSQFDQSAPQGTLKWNEMDGIDSEPFEPWPELKIDIYRLKCSVM